MHPAGDPFEKDLAETLRFNIPPILDRADSNPDNICEPYYPISFYDRHLDTQLSLKHIEINSSIPQSLSQLCETEILGFLAAGHSFTANGFSSFSSSPPHDIRPSGIGLYYDDHVAFCCHSFLSRMYFHPDYPSWDSLFHFRVRSLQSPGFKFLAEGSLIVNDGLLNPRENAVPHPLLKSLDESTTSKLKDLVIPNTALSTWELYSMTSSAHKLLKSMQTSDFKWDRPHVRGITLDHRHSPIPCDAKTEFLHKIRKGTGSRQRETMMRGPAPDRAGSARVSRVSRVRVAPALPHRASNLKNTRPYRPDPSHYLQRAWARAVVNDATFIIFYCGDRERIGIRHRESQTLYLSDSMDTTARNDPSYGAVQIGLYLATMQDALQRQRQRSSQSPSSSGKKRPAEDNQASNPDPKRRKVEETDGQENARSTIEQVWSVLSSRDLALLSLSYGAYHSPVPSSFIRVGATCVRGHHNKPFKEPSRKSTYTPAQYFSLTLSEPVGSGAIGVVHRALAEIELKSGLKVQHRLAVKLVFSNYSGSQRRLRKEHSIYQHLATKDGVEGVLPVYGLFEDTETGTLALIMDDGGSSIPYGVSAPEETRTSFIRAMTSIHQAGIRHLDLRPDNLLVNEKGETFIIDFDRAQLNSRPQAMAHELACLNHFLDGKEDEYWYSPQANSHRSESD